MIRKILIFLVIIIPNLCFAYNNTATHPGITAKAIENSKFGDYLEKGLGSILDKTKPGETLSSGT